MFSWGFSGGSDDKKSACNVGELSLIPGLGRSGGEHGNPLQYSCLENPYGQRSLEGYGPWGHKELDTTEQLNTLFYHPFSSVQLFSHVWLFATPWTAARQASMSITNSWSLLNSCPSSQWCHPTISFSVVPFSSCLQSFPVSFPMSQFFTSGGQSIRASVSASVLPMNIQNWFPLGLTGLISLQSKGLSRVFSNTTVQKHQFFGAQLSL